MERKTGIITLIVAIVALCTACASLIIVLCSRPAVEAQKDVQYVLYVGTNDKDTAQPVYPPAEALEKAKALLISRFGGYTVQEAHGGWIADDGTVFQEYTIMIHLSDTTADAVHTLCDDLIKLFNQSTILIHENETKTEFYSGK
ncbi:MAG: hypothetical protein LIR25_01110 [bacterium]|nr:hypothetical protein [bacterium]